MQYVLLIESVNRRNFTKIVEANLKNFMNCMITGGNFFKIILITERTLFELQHQLNNLYFNLSKDKLLNNKLLAKRFNKMHQTEIIVNLINFAAKYGFENIKVLFIINICVSCFLLCILSR